MNLSEKTILVAIFCLFVINCLGAPSIKAKYALPQTDTFAVIKLKGYQQVRSLIGKNGELLDYIYVKVNARYKNNNGFDSFIGC